MTQLLEAWELRSSPPIWPQLFLGQALMDGILIRHHPSSRHFRRRQGALADYVGGQVVPLLPTGLQGRGMLGKHVSFLPIGFTLLSGLGCYPFIGRLEVGGSLCLITRRHELF